MDKYEYKLKAEELRTLAANKQYMEAMKIADTIDWTRVKSVMMLNVVSEIYKMNRRYNESKEILLLAYERHPGGRSILYSLCELSIKMEEFVQAVEYYKEFVQEAPKDMGRYILQYKLYEAQEVSLEERISVLEEFKKRDYREKWAYELAFLYHRIGLATKCVEECDELILWFGEGKYVTKAMELKMLHESLTPAQMEKYQSKQKKRNSMAGEYEQAVEEMDIQIKPIDMGQYNTINLQQELAASMQELMEATDHHPIIKGVNRPIQKNSEEVFFSEEESYGEDMAIDNASQEEYDGQEEYIPQQEYNVQEEYIPQEEYAPQEEYYVQEEYVPQEEYDVQEETQQGEYNSFEEEQQSADYAVQDAGMQEIYFESEESDREDIFVEENEGYLPNEPVFVSMLSQEYDGQISLVVPESELLEKQITGQISIEDILAEWERMKRENGEKRAEDVRQRVLSQTSDLFYEFDVATRADLLKDLNELADSIEDRPLLEEETEELSESEELAAVIAEEITKEEVLTEEEPAEELIEEYYEEEPVEAELVEEYYEEELAAEEPVEEYYEEELAAEEPVEEYYEEEPAAEEPVEEYYEEELAAEEPVEEYYEEELAAEEPVEEYYEEDPVEEEPVEEYYEEEPAAEEPVEEYYEEEPTAEEEAIVIIEAEEEYVEEPAEELEYAQPERAFSQEQEQIFSSFISSNQKRTQIMEALDCISLAPYTGNIIVTGDMGTGTLTLAKSLIKEVQLMDRNFSGKVAKVSGDTLNRRNVMDTISRLKNGALLVEKAGGMSTKTLEDLEKSLETENSGIIVVMEDSKKEMDKLLARHKAIEGKFNARIDIEEQSNDALVAHGKEYAGQEEYSIDQLGVLALYTRISELQTSEHAVNVREVEEIIDEAIHHVNKKNLTHFKDILVGKRYDEEDMIVLRESDFINY